MSLTVKHLNGDSTFLLTFSPLSKSSPATTSPSQSAFRHHGQHQLPPQPPPGTFSILIDPWLSGPSCIYHPKFLLSKLVLPACIDHLSQIPEPNVVLISQEKPDHCHEATLRQLQPNSSITTILAEPSAARKIRGFKHFHRSRVVTMPTYSDKKPGSIIRFFIPPLTAGGSPGEATIAFIPTKFDVTGLHNAIGITYRPPTSAPNRSPPHDLFALTTSSFSTPALTYRIPFRPYTHFSASTTTTATTSTAPSTPQSSISSSNFHHHSFSPSSKSSSSLSPPSTPLPRPKPLSVIYTPHGILPSLLHSYVTSHLVATACLPLTCLLHSFDRVQNPWWLGGNISAGVPGGVEIAKKLMAKCWVGAHDEVKDNSGVSVMRVRTRRFEIAEVEEVVGGETKVEKLGVGAEVILNG